MFVEITVICYGSELRYYAKDPYYTKRGHKMMTEKKEHSVSSFHENVWVIDILRIEKLLFC